MEANKILSSDILDLLFEHRNKEYGAYALRRTYNKRITTALLITGAVCLLAVGGSLLASSMKKDSNKVEGTPTSNHTPAYVTFSPVGTSPSKKD